MSISIPYKSTLLDIGEKYFVGIRDDLLLMKSGVAFCMKQNGPPVDRRRPCYYGPRIISIAGDGADSGIIRFAGCVLVVAGFTTWPTVSRPAPSSQPNGELAQIEAGQRQAFDALDRGILQANQPVGAR